MNIPLTGKKTICICLTPLHVLIARQVAKSLGRTFDIGIYLSYQDDQRQRNYSEAMGDFCKQPLFDVLPKEVYGSGFRKYVDLHRVRSSQVARYSSLGKFDLVLSSCSINHHLWCLLSAVSPKLLLTYDDGLLNLQSENLTYSKTTSIFKRMLLQLSGVDFYTEKVLLRSEQHYSIYQDKNWFERSCYVPLVGEAESDSSINNECPTRTLKIFIGPAPEYPDAMWKKVEQHLRDNADSLYLPHPRDTHARFEFVQLLQTDLIIEDYVAQALKKNADLSIEITGTASSALINLSGQSRLKTRSILPDLPEHREMTALFKRHGVELV